MYDYKMRNKKLVRSIRRLAEIEEVISDEIIAESLSYEEIMDLKRDILFYATPSFKEHFIEVYSQLVQRHCTR